MELQTEEQGARNKEPLTRGKHAEIRTRVTEVTADLGKRFMVC